MKLDNGFVLRKLGNYKRPDYNYGVQDWTSRLNLKLVLRVSSCLGRKDCPPDDE